MTLNLRNLRTFAMKRHDDCDKMLARCLDELRFVLEAPDADVAALRTMVTKTQDVRARKLWEMSVILRAGRLCFIQMATKLNEGEQP